MTHPPLDEMLVKQRDSITKAARKHGIENPVVRDEELLHVTLVTLNTAVDLFGWDEVSEDRAVEAAKRLSYPAPVWVRRGEYLVMVVFTGFGERRATEEDLAEFESHAPTPLLLRDGPID